MEYKLTMPLNESSISKLKAGDRVLLSGTIYTARDAAHERMVSDFKQGIPFPVDLSDAAIYYAGPCPAKPGEIIGSCGPTTAGRMDSYTPLLIENGLRVMIGKGSRNDDVKKSIKEYKAVYLGAVGGAGALISQCITASKILAYEDLGTEAIRKLTVQDMPLIVLLDSSGCDLYEKKDIAISGNI